MNKKITTILLTLILTISIVIPITTLPSNAQTVSSKETYAFLGTNPNPVGVGQATWLHVGIPDALRFAADGFEGLTVLVTRPDNTTETLGPIRTDSTGGTGVIFTPTMVGTYTSKHISLNGITLQQERSLQRKLVQSRTCCTRRTTSILSRCTITK